MISFFFWLLHRPFIVSLISYFLHLFLVDTIDGLILPTITALAYSSNPNREESYEAIRQTIEVTRNSPTLERMSKPLANLIWDALQVQDQIENEKSNFFEESLREVTRSLGLRSPKITERDSISACYLNESLPPLFDMIMKYSSSQRNDVWTGLIANANSGGENVHRGSILGAFLGAAAGKIDSVPEKMTSGLFHKDELEKEINEFVLCVTGSKLNMLKKSEL